MAKPRADSGIRVAADGRELIDIDLRPMDIAQHREVLRGRIRMAINEAAYNAEPGRIGLNMSDLRALDYLNPTKPDPETAPAVEAPRSIEEDAEIIRNATRRADKAAKAEQAA